MSALTDQVLVIGIGNEFRSDDAAGWAVARELIARDIAGVKVLQILGDASGLLDAWKGWERVIVVDAMRSGGSPGAIQRIPAGQLDALDELAGLSTHGFGLTEAIGLAEAMGQAPPGLTIYGIEGKVFHHGYGLSPEVAKSAGQVASYILEDIQCMSTALPEI